MPRVEDDDITSTVNRRCLQQWMGCWRCLGSGAWQNSCKVVLKRHCTFVDFVLPTLRTFVARAEIALRVILWEVETLWWLDLTLPGTFRPVRGNKDILVLQGIPYISVLRTISRAPSWVENSHRRWGCMEGSNSRVSLMGVNWVEDDVVGKTRPS